MTLFAASCDDPELLNQSLGASIDEGNVIVHIVLCPGERVTFVRALEMRGEFFDRRDPVVWEISSERGSAVSRVELGVLPEGFTVRNADTRQESLVGNDPDEIQTNIGPTVGFQMESSSDPHNRGYFDPIAFADRGAERCELMTS